MTVRRGVVIILGIALAVVLLIACGGVPEPAPRQANTEDESWVSRYIDKEAGVVCWGNYRGGVFCLPIGETKLSPEQAQE